MDMIIALFIFVVAMIGCLIKGVSMIPGFLIGYICFIIVGVRRKHSLRKLLKLSLEGIGNASIVIKILLMIGILTATWRMSGIITFFVYYSVEFITPKLFIIMAFLLSCLISYALGTSLGVAATVGVILMAIARSGGVNEYVAAGAIFSGIYFGDRCSPISSSANIVAAMTKTNLYSNIRYMHQSAWLPTAITIAAYAIMSWLNPIQTINKNLLTAIETDFNLSLWLIVPVLIMLILPIFRVRIDLAVALSILSAGVVTLLLQKITLLEFLKSCIVGYYPADSSLGDILNGGGLISMFNVVGILLISSTYVKIFEGTGALADITKLFEQSISKIERFPTTTIFSIFGACIFCSQPIVCIMAATLLLKPYQSSGGTNSELAIDIANSGILLSALVPWSLAASIPLGFMGVSAGALPYAVLLYAIPICFFFTKKRMNFDIPEKNAA